MSLLLESHFVFRPRKVRDDYRRPFVLGFRRIGNIFSHFRALAHKQVEEGGCLVWPKLGALGIQL